MSVNYMQAVDAAIVLDYKGENQAVVKGLNKLKPPGMTRQIVTVDEFRNEWARKFAGGGEFTDLTYGGNYVTGDTDGQDALKRHWVNKTRLTGTDIMFFLNMDDFIATDLANDPDSAIQIVEHDIGEADKNNVYSMNGKAVPNGRLATYIAHLIEGETPTTAFVQGADGNPDTITDSGNGFVTAGFKAGMSLMIIGSTANDAINTLITEVAAGTLTLACSGEVTAGAGIKGQELHGGSI